MKIRITKILEIPVNIRTERARLKQIFADDPGALQRQLEILDALKDQDMEKIETLRDTLPYNENSGCSEKEFMPRWYGAIYGMPYIPLKEYTIKVLK